LCLKTCSSIPQGVLHLCICFLTLPVSRRRRAWYLNNNNNCYQHILIVLISVISNLPLMPSSCTWTDLWVPGIFRWVKLDRRIRLTTSMPSVSGLSRKCVSLDVSQPYGSPRHVTIFTTSLGSKGNPPHNYVDRHSLIRKLLFI
jgi:hypothetical protein